MQRSCYLSLKFSSLAVAEKCFVSHGKNDHHNYLKKFLKIFWSYFFNFVYPFQRAQKEREYIMEQ